MSREEFPNKNPPIVPSSLPITSIFASKIIKSMKNNLFVLLSMLMSFSVFAQNNAAYDALVKQLSFEAPAYSRAAAGGPMLLEEMQLGSLQLPDQEAKLELTMNLDLVHQMVAVKLNDGRTGYLPASNVVSVEFIQGEQKSVFQPMKMEGQATPTFYQVLKAGSFVLVKKTAKKLMVNSRGSGLYRFDQEYRVKGPDSNFEKVMLNVESLEKGLPKYAKQIDAISKELAAGRIMEKEVIEILTLLEERG